MPNWKKVIVSGSEASLSSLSLGDITNVSSSIADLFVASSSFASETNSDVDVSVSNLTARLGEITGNVILSSSARLILGTDTSTNNIHAHSKGGVTPSMIHFTNGGTNSGSADGFEVGISGNGTAMFWNNENTPMYFATNNITRGGFYQNGNAFFMENMAVGSLNSATHTLEVTGTASADYFTGSFVGDGSSITGLTYKVNVSGNSSYTINHNLGDSYPFVQCWNTSNSQMEIPQSVTTSNTNTIVVNFGLPFTGRIIVRK